MKRGLLTHALAMAFAAVASDQYRAEHTPEPVRAKPPKQAAKPHSFAEQRVRDKQRKLEMRSRRR